MFPPIHLRCLAAALLALCPFAYAEAAPPVAAATPAQAHAAMLFPLEIIKNRDLDFGYAAAPSAAGTIVINPETDTISATGGAMLLGGSPHAAQFTGAAKSNSVVIIRIPKQAITITRVGGTETMTVNNWTLQGLDKRDAAAKVAFDFRVGATLNVNANQAEGTYVGTFDVSIQYP
jgi:alkyl sulfatase BDS1-like metallo-beta-lactamase superfamily hydrolase